MNGQFKPVMCNADKQILIPGFDFEIFQDQAAVVRNGSTKKKDFSRALRFNARWPAAERY
jgi:hypothetical protein